MKLNMRNKFRGIITGQVDVKLPLFLNYKIIHQKAREPMKKKYCKQ